MSGTAPGGESFRRLPGVRRCFGAAVTAQIRRDSAIPRRGEGRKPMPPGVPEFREPVRQWDKRPGARKRDGLDVEAQAHQRDSAEPAVTPVKPRTNQNTGVSAASPS